MKKELAVHALFCLSTTASLSALSPIGLHSRNLDIVPNQTMQAQKDSYLKQLKELSLTNNDVATLPNILIICADDLSQQDITCYSNNSSEISTPHIDNLALGGIRFDNCYASAPICAPSRAGFMTGRDQNRFGFCTQPMDRYAKSNLEYAIYNSVVSRDNMRPARNTYIPTKKQIKSQGLPNSEITMGDLLKARGYATALIGKWHLGYELDKNPIQFGFDTHYGFTEAFSLYTPKTDSSIVYKPINLFSERHIYRRGRRKASAILRNAKVIHEKRHLTDAFAQETIAFIKKSKQENPSKPFFVLNTFNAPHTPFQAQKKYYDKLSHITDENRRAYLALILQFDDAVGQIYSYLNEACLLDNTLIVFTSDNGAATYTRAAYNDPLKGGKFSLWEGGLKVPAIFYWKDKIIANQVEQTPITHLDLFTTLACITNTPLTTDRKYDGVDLTPILLNMERTSILKRDLYWQMVYVSAIQSGDYKLIHNKRDNIYFLYNLKDDPYEKKNLSETHPLIVKELQKKLDSYRLEMSAPLWPHVMEYNYIDEDNKELKENWYPL